MSWTRVVTSRLRGLFRRERLERELDDEVRFHLDMLAEENLKAGMNPEEARNAAVRAFGAVDVMKDSYRERSTFSLVETTGQDIRYALRTLRRSPAFAVTSISVLALAIGANTAMFSVLNAVLLKPLPYKSPEQLAMLWTEIPSQNLREGRSTYRSYEQWRSQSRTFADMAVFDPVSATLTGDTGAEHVSVGRISPNFLPLIGVQPAHGRCFSEEEADQRQRLALISDRFWRSRYGASFDAIGATITLDGVPSKIIGILPPRFRLAQLNEDVYQPHTAFPDWPVRRSESGAGSWFVIGRLRPESTLAQAQSEMTAIARRLDEQLPASERRRGISVVPLGLQVVGAKSRLALWMLTGAVFCVLLIAATNVASLSLARGANREREILLRAALGASGTRIVRQLFTEGVTLAAFSGLLGLMVGWAGIRLILAVRPADLARLDEVALDPAVLGSSMCFCLLTGVLVGLAPALTAVRRNLTPGQEGGRTVAGGIAARRIRQTLVAAQFALAIVLLVGAGLLIRSLWAAETVNPGFNTERVVSIKLSCPGSARTDAQRTAFFSRVLEQVEAAPGVEGAGIIGNFLIGGNPEQAITAEGSVSGGTAHLRYRSDEVSRGFFRTLGIPLLRGRSFSSMDGPGATRVAIINEAMATRLWPGLDPLARRFKPGNVDSLAPWYTVIGVVGNMRRQGLEIEPIPQIFEALEQNPSRLETLLVKTTNDEPLKIVGIVRDAVHRVDRQAPVYGALPLEDDLGASLRERRFQTSLLIGFSAIALLMAAIGIYGLVQYSVAMRTREIGIRMAVGGQAGEIFRMVIGEGLKLSLAGLAMGLVGAFWLSRAGSSLLFGISAADPLTFLSVSVLLTAVSAAACYLPARRATKVDPIITLRQE
jgi:predicted permease